VLVLFDNPIVIDRRADLRFPFRFNEGATFVVAINRDLAFEPPLADRIAAAVAAVPGPDLVVVERFQGPSAGALEIGWRVPDALAAALIHACPELIPLRLSDHATLGYGQRAYIGGRTATGFAIGEWERALLVGERPPTVRSEVASDADISRARDAVRESRSLIRQGDTWAALDCCRRAIAIHDGVADIWMTLGALCKEVGDLEEAERALRTSLELDAQSCNAWFNRGSLHLRELNDPVAALGSLWAALRVDPSDEMAACFAAEAFVRLEKPFAARLLLELFLAAAPDAAQVSETLDQLQAQFRSFLLRFANRARSAGD